MSYFLHVDLDAFFASVEQLDNKSLQGKPVIVGSLPSEKRGVVSTASYEARKFGVHSAMPISKAYNLCPQGVFLRTRMNRYVEISNKIMSLLKSYSPDVEQVSIDEAFIDLTGTELLFGNVKDTALKLKSEIKEKFGLTISIGLASSKYIAKLASEINKPDGFFEVKNGNEKKFILSLPLKKIWGVGNKTLKKINDIGIFTTKQLYDAKLDVLTHFLGNSTGHFLYNVVRGNEVDFFDRETLSHSISSETTFQDDLLNEYDAKTAIMNLSHIVMFRLLREGYSSKTIMLKIRYDDFTTVSIRETLQYEIKSIDDLYFRSCSLFEKKYEKGRGIRLLGVAAENIVESSKVDQGELFDSDKRKKQKLENAIVNLSKKYPDIKLQKARILNKDKLKLVIFFAFSLFSATSLSQKQIYASDNTNTINATSTGSIVTDSSSLNKRDIEFQESIFNYSINDNNIEFLASGYWEALLEHTTETSFGYKNPFAISFGIPIFKQNVNLSLSLDINKTWFFSVNFADKFVKNTITAGYRGKKNLKEVLISNRNIIFPSSYSISQFDKNIGGGKNQAPGVSFSFADIENKKWKSDVAVRYDMLKKHDATFYGKNNVTSTQVNLSSWIRGKMFVLPSQEDITSINAIYVESKNGNYTDDKNNKYIKLSTSQYMLLPARSMIIISPDAQSGMQNEYVPRVLVSFNNNRKNIIVGELGKYNDNDTDVNDFSKNFLAKVQKQFSKIKIEDFAYSTDAKNHEELFTSIEGNTALLVQSPDGFSPFTCAYRYDCGVISSTEASIIYEYSNELSNNYSAKIVSDDINFTTSNFFTSSKTYADVYSNKNIQKDSRNPEVRFPLADTTPEYYLGYKAQTDLLLSLQSYTPVNRFEIGTQATSSSVQVFKNGILDTGAKYDSESGEVTLSTQVLDTDKIYITWNEDSQSFEDGAIASAIGFSYNFSPKLVADISLSSRWSLPLKVKYASANDSQTGFVSLATGITYANDNFSVSNATLASLETENVTGVYRVISFDDYKSNFVQLKKDSAVMLQKSFTPTLYDRNNANTQTLDSTKNKTSNNISGQKESNISGYVIPLSWDFTDDKYWACVNIKLSEDSSLQSATQFSFELKQTKAIQNCDIYLQLGVDASDNFNPSEEINRIIPTWKISENDSNAVSSFSTTKLDWQTVTVSLTNIDRSKLTKYSDARIIVVNNNAAQNNNTLLIGRYKIDNQSIFISTENNIKVTSQQVIDVGVPNKNNFNDKQNYVQNISWEKTTNNGKIIATKYFKEVDIAQYETVNLFFKYDTTTPTQDTPLTITLDKNAQSISEDGNIALKVKINNIKKFTNTSKYHLLSINIVDKNIYIDGQKVDGDFFVNQAIIPNRMKMEIHIPANNSGKIYFDELYLDGLSPHILLGNITKTSYKKNGIIFQTANGFPILEDFFVSATAKEFLKIGTNKNINNSKNISADAKVNATLATIYIATDAAISTDQKGLLTSAGYTISTTKNIFNVFSFSDTYRFDSAISSLGYNDKFSLDFHKIKAPIGIKFSTNSSSNLISATQNSTSNIFSSFGMETWNISINISSSVSQKIHTRNINNFSKSFSNFGYGFISSASLAYSIGNENASSRGLSNEIKINSSTPFASFKPQISLNSDLQYTSTNSDNFLDSIGFSSQFPFKINIHSFSFDWQKKGGGTAITNKGGNYISDYEYLFSTPQKRTWFFSAMPIYDIISTKLVRDIISDTSLTKSTSDSLFYSTTYNFSWNRELFNSYEDLYTPSSLSFKIARDIRTSSTVSDIYQLKMTVATTAYNILGANSNIALFKWYETDEFITSITGAVKIPREIPKNATYEISAYTQENFYITDFDVLKTGIGFTFETNGNWQIQTTAAWQRKSFFSPLASLIGLIWKNYSKENRDIERVMSTDISISSTDKKIKQSYIFSNSVNIQLLKYLTISSGATISFVSIENQIMRLSLLLTLGGKIKF